MEPDQTQIRGTLKVSFQSKNTFTLSNSKEQLKVVSVPKAIRTQTSLEDSFVSISSNGSPKFWQREMLTIVNSLFPASKCSQKWFLCRKHGSLKRHLETVLSAFRQLESSQTHQKQQFCHFCSLPKNDFCTPFLSTESVDDTKIKWEWSL